MRLRVIHQTGNKCYNEPKKVSLKVRYRGQRYEICLNQQHEREIVINCLDSSDYVDCLGVYYHLISLLMLFDGRFYPITHAFDNDVDITESMIKRELASYSSADFMFYKENSFLDFESIINEHLFTEWYALKEELDINYNMVLYCMSSVGMPSDVKCAFMIESLIGLCEIVHKKRPEFVLPPLDRRESRLKKYSMALFEKYGQEVFGQEIDRNHDAFATILVDSRNRIAHIKSKQNKVVISDENNVFYTLKLSLLYRRVLLELLGVPFGQYRDRLQAMVNRIDNNSSVQGFIDRL